MSTFVFLLLVIFSRENNKGQNNNLLGTALVGVPTSVITTIFGQESLPCEEEKFLNRTGDDINIVENS